jgi:hypothetical protein
MDVLFITSDASRDDPIMISHNEKFERWFCALVPSMQNSVDVPLCP